MSKLSIPLVLALLVMVLVSGCTMVETAQERHFRITQGWDLQRRMTIEDFDYVLLLHHHSTLSQWHARMGF